METNAILLQGVGAGVGVVAGVKVADVATPEDWLVVVTWRKGFLVLFGAAMASKIAETEIRVTERLIRSTEARSELFCCFFIMSGLPRKKTVPLTPASVRLK